MLRIDDPQKTRSCIYMGIENNFIDRDFPCVQDRVFFADH